MIYTQYGIKVRITGFNIETYPISVSVESIEDVVEFNNTKGFEPTSSIKWVHSYYPLSNLKADNGYDEIIETIKEIDPDTNYFDNPLMGGL